MALLIGAGGIWGCDKIEDQAPVDTSDATPATVSEQDNASNETQPPTNGWALYVPPEKDFSVMAPIDVGVDKRESPVGKFREYIFQQGQPYFSVTIHSDRQGPLAGNSVEELKSDTSDYVAGSVKDISLGDMPGVEFRMQGSIGESIFREYCTEDNSKSISIQVAKDLGDGFSDEEIKTFLDSFKLTP